MLVNRETDFVSRGEIFKELVNVIAMQVVACPQVEYVVTEDVPEEFMRKQIEMQKRRSCIRTGASMLSPKTFLRNS